jgi:DNA-binding CsgD family transcriptional regulator
MNSSDRRRPLLRGRTENLERLVRALHDLGGGTGAAVVVVGPDGSGRTALLDELAASAPASVRVLRVHGAPAERTWGFALVADLAHRLRSSRSALPDSLHAVLDAVTAAAPVPGPGPVAAALTALLSEAAAEAPLALLVDDADRLDPDSLAVLGTAARRLAADPLLVVLAVADPRRDELTGLPSEHLEPLGLPDAAAVVAATAGTPVASEVVDAIVDLGAGRPGVLVELTRALSGEQLAGRAPLGDPPPVGPLLEKGALAPFVDAGEDERRALRLLAVAGELPVEALILAVPTLPTSWVAQLSSTGLLVVEDGRVRLADRIARAALVHGLDDSERRVAHATVADLLAPADPMRAWHRASAVPGVDEEVAAALAAEASRARGRGALCAAAAWFERSAAVTPEPGERADRLVNAARAHLDAGHPAPAAALLDEIEAVRCTLPAGRAADAIAAEAASIGSVLALAGGAVDQALARLHHVVGLLASSDPVRGAHVLLDALPGVLRAGHARHAPALLADAAALLDADPAAAGGNGEGDRALEVARLELGRAAVQVATAGPVAEPDLARAVHVLLSNDASSVAYVAECAGLALVWSERYAAADALLEGLERRARAGGAPGPLATVRVVQALCSMRRGRLRDASVAAGEAVGASDETVAAGTTPFALAVLAVVEAQRGEVDGCLKASERLLARAAATGDRRWEVPARAARGLLALGEGRPGEAVVELEPLARTTPAAPWVVMWEGDLVESLIATGRRQDATELLARLDGRGTWSSGRARAVRERLTGLLLSDTDAPGALEHLRRAADASAAAGAEMGRARARLAEGRVLRRARRRREAAVALEDARVAFVAMGAQPWARAAAVELVASGGSAVAAGAVLAGTSAAPVLTPQELQVARLVAGGASNREVADQLFVSVRTVESHLGRVYRKLGVRSRGALTARSGELLDGGVAP